MPATTSPSLSKSTLSSPDDPSTPSIPISADPTRSTSPPESSLSSNKTPAVGSSKLPRQRSFLNAAQKVMMQEKIRKAEDQAKDEECGKWSFAICTRKKAEGQSAEENSFLWSNFRFPLLYLTLWNYFRYISCQKSNRLIMLDIFYINFLLHINYCFLTYLYAVH